MALVSILYGRVVSSQFQTKLYIVAYNSTSAYKNTINHYKSHVTYTMSYYYLVLKYHITFEIKFYQIKHNIA